MKKDGILVLENGETFYGESFAHKKINFGEVVFNTSMTGYQEILTDPSYKRQIITMTYPEIGNYGIIKKESQSKKIHAHGFIVKNYNHFFYNPDSEGTLSDFLKKEKIVALKNIDTRRLTRIIRDQGAMEAVISSKNLKKDQLLKLLQKQPRFNTFDLAKEVSTKKPYWFFKSPKERYLIGVWDFGVKTNILTLLANYPEVSVVVFPMTTPLEEILSYQFSGLLLSNGPGDPNTIDLNVIETIQNLIGRLPIFGICFGHQVLLKALGHEIYKLKFGHRGANHPIKNTSKIKTSISSQNHGYAVSGDKLSEKDNVEMNLNDNTVAGCFDLRKKCFSVQYHPEASPGPQDSYFHFDSFIELVKKNKKNAS